MIDFMDDDKNIGQLGIMFKFYPLQAVHYGEEGSPVTSVRKRSSRLSMRKGRSIVHKNLEDNYGAVITANHEAIAQILEQVWSLYFVFISYLGQRYTQDIFHSKCWGQV